MEVAPSRARGLKRVDVQWVGLKCCRALTGAWIETTIPKKDNHYSNVAPSRARGLKLGYLVSFDSFACRALTGAWIETFQTEHRRRHQRASRPHGRVD